MRTSITPSYPLTIVRQLSAPNDTNTYYVRAFIRRSADDSLIETINLTDKGSQRFTHSWIVPAYTDETEIDVETRVYNDSGYTTENDMYYRENIPYVIRGNVTNFGGGGSSISYSDVKKIVDGSIKTIVMPEMPKTDLSKVYEMLKMVEKAIKDKPVTDKTDLTPIQTALNGIRNDLIRKVDNIPQPDLEPLQNAVMSQAEEQKRFNDILEKMQFNFNSKLDEFQTIVDKMKPFYFEEMGMMQEKMDSLKEDFKNEIGKIRIAVLEPEKEEDEQDN